MAQQTYEAGVRPRVVIRGGDGAVELAGWDERQIALETAEDIEVYREADTLTVSGARGALRLRLPNDASVVVEDRDGGITADHYFGNLAARGVGDVVLRGRPDTARRIFGWRHGNVELERVGAVQIEVAAGNLTVDGARSLAAQAVGGNAEIRGVAGDVAAENVGGNLSAADLRGQADFGNVGGNAALRGVASMARLGAVGGNVELHGIASVAGLRNVGGNLSAEEATFSLEEREVSVAVGGNARLRLPEDASVRVSAMAGGHVRFEGRDGSTRSAHTASATFGEGRGQLRIMAGGNVEVRAGQR
jgi:hypothetical protein